MLRQVNLGAVDGERGADFGGGTVFDHDQMVNRVMRGVDQAFDAPQRFVEATWLPFGFPKGIEVGGGIGEVFGRGGTGTAGRDLGDVIVRGGVAFGVAGAFAELVGDFPADDLQKPAFEGVFGGIVLELRHSLGDGEQRILQGFLGFVFVEAGAARDAEDEAAIRLVEFGPARVRRVFDGMEQAGAGGQ